MIPKILFVCVENSCRSQMAEGFARQLAGDSVEVYSAGSKASGCVNPTAIAVMLEKGIDLRRYKSKGLHELPTVFWSAIVTMGCGEDPPRFPVRRRLDWKLADPSALPLEGFRRVRDQIEAKVAALLAEVAKPSRSS